jgi:antitoxin (DNA-binding transcriptional repressor) of toxin-antitoxin stability system
MMKFLSVRDLRGNSARVWRELPGEREMVVTSNGRPVAVLTAVDEGNVEQSLAAWRQVRATQAIAVIQRQSVQNGTDQMSMDEIDDEIAKLRQDRRKRSR